MKYSSSQTIQSNIEYVTKLLQDTSQYHLWQDGFISINPLETNTSGNSRNRLFYQMKNNEMELTETILEDEMPMSKTCLYEHKHMVNTLKTSFRSESINETIMTYEVDCLKFNHFIPRLMAKLFPGMFNKQSDKWMHQLKALAEK